MRSVFPTSMSATKGNAAGRLPLLWLIVSAVVMALLLFQSPRSAALVMAIASVAAIGASIGKSAPSLNSQVSSAPSLSMLAFGGFALLSTIWSADRGESASKPLFLALLIAGTAALVCQWQHASRVSRQRLVTAAVVALVAALALAAFESISDQMLTKAIYTAIPGLQKGVKDHIRVEGGVVSFITETNIKRRIGLFTLLIWPALLAVATVYVGRCRNLALAAVVGLASIMIFIGPHQSSWFAGVASIAIFVLAQLSRTAARRFLAAGFVAWVLLALPLVWTAYKLELQNAPWVPHSARHRVVIWNATANEVLKAPLLGVGANATRKIFEDDQSAIATSAKGAPVEANDKIALNRHAHNAYVQIWFELGAVGALLLAFSGAATVSAIRRISPSAQPFAYAQFAATTAVMSSSYGIWQMWFIASMAMGATALICAAVLAPADEDPLRQADDRPG